MFKRVTKFLIRYLVTFPNNCWLWLKGVDGDVMIMGIPYWFHDWLGRTAPLHRNSVRIRCLIGPLGLTLLEIGINWKRKYIGPLSRIPMGLLREDLYGR